MPAPQTRSRFAEPVEIGMVIGLGTGREGKRWGAGFLHLLSSGGFAGLAKQDLIQNSRPLTGQSLLCPKC